MATNETITSGNTAELHIEIWRGEYAQYTGAAAQLRAEGLVPDGFEWPRAAAGQRWEANGFAYWLRRTRPEGHKGPKSSWLELDNWFLRVSLTGHDHHWFARKRLERDLQDLAARHYSHTPRGSAEWDANWRRYWQTVEDKRFQAFKSLVPGLVPPKRRRKTKPTAAASSPGVGSATPPAGSAGRAPV